MASPSTFRTEGTRGYALTLNIAESVNAASNTSTITYSLVLTSGNYSFSQHRVGYAVTLNGASVISVPKASATQLSIGKNSSLTLCTGSTVVAHNADGHKTMSVAYSMDINAASYTSGPISGSGSSTLTVIPRASSLTVKNGTLGTAQTISINKAASTFTHTISYTCGSVTEQIITKTSATSVQFTPAYSLASQNTAGTSLTCTFTVHTYSGNTLIGSNAHSIVLTIPNNATTKPTVATPVVSPVNIGLSSTFDGVYIKGVSKVAVTQSASGKYGASISALSTTIQGKTYSGASVTTDVLGSAGNVSVTTTARDSRGFTNTSEAVAITVLDYAKPSIIPFNGEKEIICGRCTADGTLNSSGTSLKIRLGRRYSKLLNDESVALNTATLKYRYKLSVSSTYGDWITLLSPSDEEDYCDVVAAVSLNVKSTYDVQLCVIDDIGNENDPITLSIPTEEVTFHLGYGGTSIGVGRYAVGTRTNPVPRNRKRLDIADDWRVFFGNQELRKYEIGDCFISENATPPDERFGGEWTAVNTNFYGMTVWKKTS